MQTERERDGGGGGGGIIAGGLHVQIYPYIHVFSVLFREVRKGPAASLKKGIIEIQMK